MWAVWPQAPLGDSLQIGDQEATTLRTVGTGAADQVHLESITFRTGQGLKNQSEVPRQSVLWQA